jgi:hypothetical protein
MEIKTECGKVNPEQQAFIDHMNAEGSLAFVACRLNDVMGRGL